MPESSSRRDLREELVAVRRRGVRAIDGKKSLSAIALPQLEQLISQSPWAGMMPRNEAVRRLILAGARMIPPDAVIDSQARVRIEVLYGLEDRWRLYSPHELLKIAARDLEELQPNSHERGSGVKSRQSRWIASMIDVLLVALQRAVELSWVSPIDVRPNHRSVDLGPRPGFLVGRTDALARMTTTNSKVILVTGTAGVGKTSLGTEFAHRVSDSYTGGCIQVDFLAYSSAKAVDLVSALQGILVRLGYAADDLPADERLLSAMYKSYASAEPVLLFADNIADSRIALALTTHSDSLLIVSSRSSLPALLNETGVEVIELEPLKLGDGVDLIAGHLGKERVEREPEAAAQLVAQCGSLPLALTIVAAKLRRRTQLALKTVVSQLATAELGVLAERLPESEHTLTSVLDWSLDELTRAQQTSLIALANLPFAFTDTYMAAELGIFESDLEVLIDEHLISSPNADNAFKIHDLVERYLCSHRVGSRLQPADYEEQLDGIVEKLRTEVREGWQLSVLRRMAGSVDALAQRLPLVPAGMEYPVGAQWAMACGNLMRFALQKGQMRDFESGVVLLDETFDLLAIMGELELATTAASYAFDFLADWQPSDPQEEQRRSLGVATWLQNLATLATYARIFAVRAGWPKRTQALFDRIAALGIEQATEVDLDFAEQWQRLYGADDIDELVQTVWTLGESMQVQVDDPETQREELDWVSVAIHMARMERQARRDWKDGDNEWVLLLWELWDRSKRWVEELPTVDVLWSVEPPLLLLAYALEDLGQKESALDVLKWVERLYSSRMMFHGHVRAVRSWIDELKSSH